MNIAQWVEDTHDLTELLLKRFHQKSLILVGSSWGSVIGIETVKKYPESYRAFVGTGQIANFTEGMNAGYRFLLVEAKKRNDMKALNELTKIGPPPYVGLTRRVCAVLASRCPSRTQISTRLPGRGAPPIKKGLENRPFFVGGEGGIRTHVDANRNQ